MYIPSGVQTFNSDGDSSDGQFPMSSTNLSRVSSEDDTTIDRKLLNDLTTFQKTTFAAFLHYALDLVDAVPRRDRPAHVDEINNDLEMCLTSIIAAMEDKNNEGLMRSIEQELESYCQGSSEVNRREALVKAMNAALILLASMSIGNSRPAADPYSVDFPLFVCPMKRNERMPGIVFTARKHIDQKENLVRDHQQVLKHFASQSAKDHVLEWKHYHSCWEYLRGSEQLDMKLPASYTEGYPGAASFKEHGHTVNYDPSLEDRYGNKDASQVDTHLLNAKRCTKDAAKVFYDTLGRDHIMNVAINDNLLRVWYFDHESPIQTSAFNFVEDLPYFLLFLFALQRFSPADWGYVGELSPANAKVVEPINLSDSGNKATFQRVPTAADYHHISLCGRATHVVFGRFNNGEKDIAAAFKLSWRQKVRFPEGTFLREAMSRLQQIDCLEGCDYLPTLLAERDFPEFSTDIIRRRLMIPVREEETRIPYFIVLPQYEPLIVRTTDWNAFFDDYVALIYCHFMLWTVGIEHGDISRSNLMWDPDTKKPKLCDFDLASFSDKDRPPGFTNTGTYRFMAFDLLTLDAMEGEVKRLYRHDLESFVAVLIWVTFRYDNGKLRNDPNNPLAGWSSSSYSQCATERRRTFKSQIKYNKPPSADIPLPMWNAAVCCAAQCMIITASSEAMVLSTAMDPLAAEEQKRLDYLNSIGAVMEFLGYLASESIGSQLAYSIAQKIKDRIRQQESRVVAA